VPAPVSALKNMPDWIDRSRSLVTATSYQIEGPSEAENGVAVESVLLAQ